MKLSSKLKCLYLVLKNEDINFTSLINGQITKTERCRLKALIEGKRLFYDPTSAMVLPTFNKGKITYCASPVIFKEELIRSLSKYK